VVAIRSSLHAVLEGKDVTLQERYRALLGRAAVRADQLIDMINDLTALSADRSDLRNNYQEVDLAHLLVECVSNQSPVIEAKKLVLCMDLPNEPFPATCNRYGVEKVVANLLSNACRYNVPGGQLSVSLALDEGSARIRVTDTGIGIPEAERERVFDEFYRASNARSAVSFGSGLGLALVKKVVLEHGGRIDVQSAVGAGTTFTVWIPLRRGKE
jgi:signal transduction histidine kinase